MHIKSNLKYSVLLLLLTFSKIFALPFSYDNYSKIPLLKYSFSFNGKDWFQSKDSPSLAPKGFKTVEFGNSIPPIWKIETKNNISLFCWNTHDREKKEVPSIVTLTLPNFMTLDDLLLDVINEGPDFISIGIIDMEGDDLYSNRLDCEIKTNI
jgi:hypothetical protein